VSVCVCGHGCVCEGVCGSESQTIALREMQKEKAGSHMALEFLRDGLCLGQIRNLRERLYEEHQALRQREADNRALRRQVEELTQLMGRAFLQESSPALIHCKSPRTPDWEQTGPCDAGAVIEPLRWMS
jgi:hypothetical protein